MRWLWTGAGWLSVTVGLIGAFVPLLPTTPFLLLAAACFARGSPRVHAWLLAHPRLGPPIADWQQHGVVRPRAKFLALLVLWATLAYPIFSSTLPLLGRAALGGIGLGVSVFLLTRPSRAGARGAQRAANDAAASGDNDAGARSASSGLSDPLRRAERIQRAGPFEPRR